jgi:uncharacterized phage-associated protein
VIETFGGRADVLPLIKALYLADRKMLGEAGRTVTGDTYASLKHGPVLSGTYSLLRGKASSALQRQWDTAFSTAGNSVSMRGAVDKGALSPREEEILREQAARIMRLWNRSPRVDLSAWIHKECPEWENPGNSSRKLPVSKIAAQLESWKGEDTSHLDAEIAYTAKVGAIGCLANKPLLAANN